MRVLAVMAVIALHVGSVGSDNPDDRTARLIGGIFGTIGRWCVPALIMLSGALLLHKADESPREFYRKRLHRVAAPMLFWSIVYFVYHLLDYPAQPLRMRFLLGMHDALAGGTEWHLWFLSAIAGLYLVTPFLREWIAVTTPRRHMQASLTLLALASASQLSWMILQVNDWQSPASPVLPSIWMFYVGYYLLGAAFRDATLTARGRSIAGAIFALGIVLVFVGVRIAGRTRGFNFRPLFDSYLSPLVVCMSIAGFLWLADKFNQVSTSRFGHQIKQLSADSFGAYLVHMLIFRLTFSFAVGCGWWASHSTAVVLLIAPISIVLSFVAARLIRISPTHALIGC